MRKWKFFLGFPDYSKSRMKGRTCFFFIIALLSAIHFADAVESDLRELGSHNMANNDSSSDSTGVNLQLTDLGKVEEENKKKKTDEETEKGVDKDYKPLEEPKQKPEQEEGSNGSLVAQTLPVKDPGGAEECDPSNRCMVEKSNFVACLRVPGKDSLDLSLLIQNKGTGDLDVDILAPDLELEQNKVKVKSKDHKEVKVIVKDGANGTVIVLKAGEGNCSLDFGNMISNSVVKKMENPAASSRYLSGLSKRVSLILILMVAVVLLGLALSSIRRLWRPKSGESGWFRKVVMEVGLPVVSTAGGKKEVDVDGGWDNSSWGDGWDDEEAAPVTPSKPAALTPSSRGGLASRRFNKDGWKD